MQFLTTQILPVLYDNQKQSMKKNKIRGTGKSYMQGRHSNQCHRAMALVVFLPRPESQYIHWASRKNLQSPKWHSLFLPPIGANAYMVEYYFIIMGSSFIWGKFKKAVALKIDM